MEWFYYWKWLEKSTGWALFVSVIWQVNLENGSIEKQRNHSCQFLAVSHLPPLHRGAQAISLAFFKEEVFSNTASVFRALLCGNLTPSNPWSSASKSNTYLLGRQAALGLGTGVAHASIRRKLFSISHLDWWLLIHLLSEMETWALGHARWFSLNKSGKFLPSVQSREIT